MCLVGIAIAHYADFPLVIVANRDEFHNRPTQTLHRWRDQPQIIAGRDLQAQGTWLGATINGRLAVLTNIRGYPEPPADAISRGALVTDFLGSQLSAAQWLLALQDKLSSYAGFNLIVSDNLRDVYLTSSHGGIKQLQAGVHALSNGRYGEPWPKTQKLCEALAHCADPASTQALQETLESRYQPPDADLPNTGVEIDKERLLAPALIVSEDYGTRATTVFQLNGQGEIALTEYTRDIHGHVISRAHESWRVGGFSDNPSEAR